MELFKNLIYEYKKGMRDLALYTCETKNIKDYINLLQQLKIAYITINLGNTKTNIFFGTINCIKILKNFSSENLDKLSPQEDFILGIMLGYSRNEQYNRFLSKI